MTLWGPQRSARRMPPATHSVPAARPPPGCRHPPLKGEGNMTRGSCVSRPLAGRDGVGVSSFAIRYSLFRSVREAVAVFGAVLALPVVAGCQRIDVRVATARTTHAIRPAACDQIRPASILVRKRRFKLRDRHLRYGLGLSCAGHGRSSHSVEGHCHA